MLLPFVPYATNRRTRRVPYVTGALLALNVIAFLAAHLWGTASPGWDAAERLGFIPDRASWYALFTAAFVHANWLHLLGNMLFLWLFGTLVEDAVGGAIFASLYLASHLAAALLYIGMGDALGLAMADRPLVGASGAIAGIMGIAAVRFYRTRIRIGYWVVVRAGSFEVAAWVFLLFWVGWQVTEGVISTAWQRSGVTDGGGVAYWAHVGGFLFGALGAGLLKLRQEGKREYLLEDLRSDPLAVAPDVARRELGALAQTEPADPRIHYALAKRAAADGDLSRAGHEYMAAIDRYLEQRQNRAAVLAYEELIGYFPQCVLPVRDQLSLGRALETERQYPMSVEVFERLVERYPQTPEAEIALIRAAEVCTRRLRDPMRARRLLQHLLEKYPASAWRDAALAGLREAEESAHFLG
jgi:membrane associated rhomboid family serine protease